MSRLTTEARNPASEKIDTLSPLEIVRLMNAEDARVAEAVGREAEPIARAIDLIAARLWAGCRLVYIGAGTSGTFCQGLRFHRRDSPPRSSLL
jgi:N-acetylmuramic acid 6-phosphate etherase